jgi:nicotinamide-nucleotide amidase
VDTRTGIASGKEAARLGGMLKDLMLASPRLTLAVAESFTGGRLQARITAVSGASGFFLGGLTAYTIAQKVRHLGVARAEAEAVNAVSAEVARQMARGVCSLFGADMGLATTGYAEAAASPPGTQAGGFWAICHRLPDNTERWREGTFDLPGCSRVEAQDVAADVALAALVASLREWRAKP